MTTTRTVAAMTGDEEVPEGYVIGAECDNGHRNREVEVDHAAEKGDRLECVECSQSVTQCLLEDQ